MAKNGKQYAKISGTWHQIKPSYDDLTDIPTDFNPTTHTHGNMNDDGQISASAPIASGDHLVIADHSANNDLTTSSITFGTGTTTFLRNDGTWGTPAGTSDTNNYLTGVSGSGDGTVTFTRSGLSSLTWNAAHTHSEYLLTAGDSMSGDLQLDKDGSTNVGSHGIKFQANTSLGGVGDYTTELNMDAAGNLKFGTNTLFHSGNDGSASGIDADLLDGQQGSYYLNYNNLSNTPTLITNNNQLTNGAGYITSFTNNYLTGVSGSGDGTVTFTRNGLGNLTWDASHSHSEYAPLASPSFTGNVSMAGGLEISGDLEVVGNSIGFIDTNFDAKIEVSDANPNGTGAVFDFYGDGVSRNATLSAEQFDGNAATTTKWLTARTITLGGDLSGSVSLDGSANVTLTAAVADNSHSHTNYAPLASPALTGTPTAPTPTAGDNDTSIATTAFVSTAIDNLVNGASASFDTLKEIQDAMATDTELSNAIAGLTIGNGTQTISVGTGLDGGGSFTANQTGNSTVSISLDLSEFTDMTADVNGLADELILLDGGAERRKLISEIKLSQFNNDSGWTSNVGDITNVTANNGLTGGGSSGSVTISHADTSTQSSVNNSGNTFIQDITLDTYGHITGLTSATASTTDSTKLPLAGGTMTGDLTMDHDGTGTSADSHGVVFTGRAVNTDFTRELYMDSGANLKFGTDTIFHSGNDGSSSGLHADLLDGQQGSYYLDYNNFTNTPTIPTGDITGVTAGSGLSGGGTSGTVTISHADTSSQASVNNSGRTYIQDITLDTYGHITGITSATETVTNTNTVTSIRRDNTGTYRTGNINLVGGNNVTITETSAGVFSFAATDTNTVYTHPTHPGDDINLDTGALTGATVISDLDFNITSDTLGHITDANATYSTRNLTASDIGAAASSHNHSAGEIVTGNFNTARLGSGTATSGYVLKSDGDGTASWQQDNNTTYTLGSFGVTATAAELNKMDGVTATTAELNKMDGVTATTTELNYTDGVTSNIQTQLNGKLSTTGTAAQASAVSYVTSCPTANNTTGMKVYVGSTDCSTKYSGWLYLVT